MMTIGFLDLKNNRGRSAGLLAVLFVAGLGISGCGGGGGDSNPTAPTEPTTAPAYVTRGWARFEQGNFSGSLSDFNAALGLDAALGAAHAGQGWARLVLATSSISMQAAGNSFDSAQANGEAGAYVLAGRAAASLGSGAGALGPASTQAQAALAADATFVFAHRATFNAQDLWLIDAFARSGLGDFAAALAAADHVLASGITAGNPTSWQVDGVVYESFNGAVLAHLNKLSGQFSG